MSRMRLFWLTVVVFLAVVAIPRDAMAWNRAGHMVSGAIAYRELLARDPAAARRAVEILRAHPAYQSRWLPMITAHGMADHDILLFMLAARWPDDVRDEPYDHPTWHYINLPVVPPRDTTRPPVNTSGELVVETAHNLAVLRDPESADADKAIALAWVLHLVGDIHQPLHATNFFSTRWPQGDRGGNSMFIRATPTSQSINLHSFWDGLIIGSDDTRSTMNRAIALRAAHPAGTLAAQITILSPMAWAADESLPLARQHAYLDGGLGAGTVRDSATVLPAAYAANAQRVAEERVTLAGYRMGALLAQALKPGSGRREGRGARGEWRVESGESRVAFVRDGALPYSTSSIDFGQSLPRSRESARSARRRPPVWQRAQ